MRIKLYGYDKNNKEIYVGTFSTQNAAFSAIQKFNLKSYFFYRLS